MTWTDPKTWQAEDVLTSGDLNTHVRDNLLELKDPPTDSYTCDEGSDWTTTSTSFVDVHANFSFSITTNGGDVMVGFVAPFGLSAAGGYVWFTVTVDGVVKFPDDGGAYGRRESTYSMPGTVSAVWLLTDLDADEYTINLQWKVSAGTGTLYAGAGTGNADVHPQFWVREVS